MRGGAQAHLMRCSDGELYVVKFRNNPQHVRVLANEMIATRLAECAGLPVPTTKIVEVGRWLIDHTPDLHIQLANNIVLCQAGLQFGSRYIVNPLLGRTFDYFPAEMLSRVRNLHTFAGMLALDKWTGNKDSRQVVFWRYSQQRKYSATFIDQGYCFNAGEWTFQDHPLSGVYAHNEVYKTILGWQSFEPWLSAIEQMNEEHVWKVVAAVPPEWYGAEWSRLEELVTTLLSRRRIVRTIIEEFRCCPRNPFPHWSNSSMTTVA
ncbi:MAG: HipA family kinase [Candidatus Sulfotelmatobacter sp.]